VQARYKADNSKIFKTNHGKLNLNQQKAKGASGTSLIPDSSYLFPMQWNGKSVIQKLRVFKNLTSLLILGIDAIDNLCIIYISRIKKFYFPRRIGPPELPKG
jgi:hypothetical protein